MTRAAAGRSRTLWHFLHHPESFCVTIRVFIFLKARKPHFSTTCKLEDMDGDTHFYYTTHSCLPKDRHCCMFFIGVACFYLVCAPVTGLKWAGPNRKRCSFFFPLIKVKTVQFRTCLIMSVRWTFIMLKRGRGKFCFWDINCVGNSSKPKSVDPLPSIRKIPGP